MAFESTWRQHEVRSLRGLGALVVFSLITLALLVTAVSFLWPRHVGSVSAAVFDAGKVETFEVDKPVLIRADNGVSFWLVRLDEGKFVALSVVEPLRGCTVPWRPSLTFNGTQGWFRDPCYGSTFDLAGIHVFGPSPWNMDRFDVSIQRDRVRVIADERFIHRSVGPDFAPRPYVSPRPR